MTPRTVTLSTGEPGQRAKALCRKERLQAEDNELCGQVGEEFGLGPLRFASHAMEAPSWPSGIPNGIFFAHAVARAAMRNGGPADGSAEAGR